MSGRDYKFRVKQTVDWQDPEYLAAQEAFIASRADGFFGWMVDPARPLPPVTGKWEVCLPHQCDEWMIAGEKYVGGVEHDAAVVALQEFIAQAQDALAVLEQRHETGE